MLCRQPLLVRRGFMLRDLVVAIILFVLTAGILLPGCGGKDEPKPPPGDGVQGDKNGGKGNGIRQQEALAGTTENLRKLGLALFAANDTFKKLPPAWGAYGAITADNKPAKTTAASIHVHLLPFTEQANLYNAIVQGGMDMPAAAAAVLPLYLSPADTTTVGNGERIQNFAANLRVFCDQARNSKDDAAVQIPDKLSPGWVSCSIGLFNGFPDGTSNTLAFATRYSVCQGTTLDYRAAFTSPAGSFFAAHAPADSARAGASNSTAFTFQNAPSPKDCNNTRAVYGHGYGASGLTVCTADGAVRQISPAMSGRTWRAAVHPSDGRPLGPDFEK